MSAHRAALLDWLACAYGGREQRAAQAARAADDGVPRVAWLGTAGTCSTSTTRTSRHRAPERSTAPAVIAVAAALDRSVGDALAAYAAGFEAMGRLTRAHRLYDGGWHPTAVCGAAGAAHVAARLLGLDDERAGAAERLALLRRAGCARRSARGKSLPVGMAAAAGCTRRGSRPAALDHGRRDRRPRRFGPRSAPRGGTTGRRSTRTGSSRGRAA